MVPGLFESWCRSILGFTVAVCNNENMVSSRHWCSWPRKSAVPIPFAMNPSKCAAVKLFKVWLAACITINLLSKIRSIDKFTNFHFRLTSPSLLEVLIWFWIRYSVHQSIEDIQFYRRTSWEVSRKIWVPVLFRPHERDKTSKRDNEWLYGELQKQSLKV